MGIIMHSMIFVRNKNEREIKMLDRECVPFAPTLIESMRSLGYSFPAAIADLIDNSISAKANKITIIAEPSSDPDLIIFDDGCGMSFDELYEAMRYGSANPLDKRSEDDLGRFGLGLKSASLSQCRKLVVISKRNGTISAYSWDLDYVISKGRWMLKGFSDKEIEEFPYVSLLNETDHGTYIYLSEFDRLKSQTGNISESFSKALGDMEEHISLVFHRFIDNGLVVELNGRELDSKDPFLSEHPATQRKKEENIYIKGNKIVLKPYILPHLSKLSQSDLDKLGGKERLKNEQGFYVYRNQRLIIWGTWFRLERKDELNKLARVRVDIPNTLDDIWAIDIKKSSATLPDMIKQNMYAAVYESVVGSEGVHTHRGRKENASNDIDYVWERIKKRDGYEYLINRDIPQLKMLVATLSDQQIKMLDATLDVIEEAFPINALYVDAAKGKIEEKPQLDENVLVEQLWEELVQQMKYVECNGLPVDEYYTAFSKVEPYCNYPTIVARIQKELENND